MKHLKIERKFLVLMQCESYRARDFALEDESLELLQVNYTVYS